MHRMGGGTPIDPTKLVKSYGIDPLSAKGGQDFSAKQFKNVRFDEHWAALCAQEISNGNIYCMGQEDYPQVQDIYNVDARDFFIRGTVKNYINDKTEKLKTMPGYGILFHPADNLAKPLDLKYKAIIAPTAAYGHDVLVTAGGNVYDDGTSIPENTLVVSMAPKTLMFENATGAAFGLGSTKAGGNQYSCLLLSSGKVDCKYFENGRETSGSPIVKNFPSSLRVK
jgi:hypothetical protein